MKKTIKIMPVINQKIKEKRKELKIIQEDFTKLINKSLGTVKRYDTGDIIPENTLILICDKLNLDKFFLLEEQEKQNKLQGTFFYDDLINKKINFEKAYDRSLNNTILECLNFLYKGLTYYPSTSIDVKFQGNKFYIFTKEKTLDIFTQEEAKNLLNDMQEYFEFKTERLRKEKLNK